MLDPHQEGFSKLVALIEALEVGMLTTADNHGHLRSRPMQTLKADAGAIWFLTAKDAPKIWEVRKDAEVNVSYADPNNQGYVSVSGAARIFQDPAKVRELWNDKARRWFPQGPDAPNLAILKVEIAKAEYWDVDKRAMVQLLDKRASAEDILSATDNRKLS